MSPSVDPDAAEGPGPDDSLAVDVPDGEEPAARCPHCGRPFARERLLDLHVGEEHVDVASDAEREAYEAAVDAEGDELFVYHMKVVATIVLLFFAFTYTYAAVWSG